MTPVFQTIIDQNHGNCLQAAIASLFDMKLEEVPHFTEQKEWYHVFSDFLKTQGIHPYPHSLHNKKYEMLMHPTRECFKEGGWYAPSIITPGKLQKHSGINGYFYAKVCSPAFFKWDDRIMHAVIIDRDFNVAHDPNPDNKNILKYPFADLIGYNGVTSIELINEK